LNSCWIFLIYGFLWRDFQNVNVFTLFIVLSVHIQMNLTFLNFPFIH
jgi:hypothetical protein